MEPFHDLGLRLQEAIAGFFGGIVFVFVTKNTKPIEAVGSIVVGTITANYLAGYVTAVGLTPGASGFVTGLCGMALCQGIIAAARKNRNSNGG